MTEERDFDVEKSEEEWQQLYGKHDILEEKAVEFLENNGFTVEKNGIDKRDKQVWEAGEDEPDAYVYTDSVGVYIDWKAKSAPHNVGKVNERAYESYSDSEGRVFLCFGIVSEENVRQMAFADVDRVEVVDGMEEWDKNDVVELGGNAYLSSVQFAEYGDGSAVWYRTKGEVLDDPRPRPSPVDDIREWVSGEDD